MADNNQNRQVNQRPLFLLFINLGLGGVQRKIVDIANYLGKSRPDLPIFILLRNETSFNLEGEITNPRVRIVDYRRWAKIKLPLFFPVFVIYQIWCRQPRAVLAFLDFCSLPVLWARLLLPFWSGRVVLSEDHYASRVVPLFTLGRFRNWLMKIFYPLADVVFTCSQATRQDLIKNYRLRPEQVRVAVNWTTFAQRRPKVKEKAFDLVYVGRFFQTKNLPFLIKAIAALKEKRPKIKALLVGEGQEEKRLRAMVHSLGLESNVVFAKPRRDVENAIGQAKILVLVSKAKAEGLPLVILEAMALKTPVVAADFAGGQEFLRDGENCLLFRNRKEFVKKVAWLLAHPRQRAQLAEKAYRYVKKRHSLGNLKVYLQALGLEK